MARRMNQMLRSSREVRRSGPSPRRSPIAESIAEAEATVAEELPLEIESHLSPPETPPLGIEAIEPEIAVEEVEVEEAPPPLRPEEEIHQTLIAVADQIFTAAAQHLAPDEGALIAALQKALNSLKNGDALLAETVRQRQESRTWPQRAANTAVMAMRLGMELGYDERRCLAMGLCALMHDLGMLKVPEEVLSSRKLSDEQLALLRQHPVESQKMVTAFGASFNWIGKIVIQVHERQDGSGYPRGLRGNQIHEMAQVLGLIDTYEAMAHPRADRKARVTYHALKEIIDLRNTLFERRLIKALIHIVSIFPLGSLVKLNNGEIGRVIGTSRLHPTRPQLEVLVDSRGRPLPQPRRLDLEDEPMLYIVDPAIDEGILERTDR